MLLHPVTAHQIKRLISLPTLRAQVLDECAQKSKALSMVAKEGGQVTKVNEHWTEHDKAQAEQRLIPTRIQIQKLTSYSAANGPRYHMA